MNRTEVRKIYDSFRKEVENMFAHTEFSISKVNCRYGDNDIKFTVTIERPDKNGLSKDESALDVYAEIYGLPKGLLNKKITMRGKTFEIIGFVPRRHRYPIMALETKSGKEFKLTTESVKLALGVKNPL